MKHKSLVIPALLVLLALTAWASLMFGGTRLPADNFSVILWQIRIPRVLLGMIVGAGLAVSGCAFQGILRNPLADPYTLGVSGGAALGSTFGMLLGLGSWFLPAAGFAGALSSIFLVYAVSNRKYFSVSALILAGVVLSFLSGSLVLLVFALLSTDRMQSAMIWLMGDLSSADPSITAAVAVFVGVAFGAMMYFSRELDILSLGEEKASHLGVDSQKMLKVFFVIASLAAGACVSASGIIGFVGLLVPHFVRRFTGPSHALLVPASALGGAIFLCAADAAARSVLYPVELPVGVITGIFGGTVFLIMLLRSKSWSIL